MGVLICITASEDIQLDEVNLASQMIYEEAHPDATIIWGTNLDPTLEDEMRVTIIATGFSDPINKLAAKAIDQGVTIIEKKPTETETPVVEEKEAEPADASILSALQAVEKENAAREDNIAEIEVKKEEPETVVTSIPSRHSSQDTFKAYDNLFSNLKKRK